MPYEEFEAWQHYYLLEPWGWHDREYRTGATLAMMANVNASKKSQTKNATDFMRDMPSLIAKAIAEQKRQERAKDIFKTASAAERKRMIVNALGVKLKDK